jgi:hypothetical protein
MIATGCVNQSTWSPTVDPYGDPNAAHIAQDQEECRQLAQHASGGTANETVKQGVVGGLFGAATGAAIGAIAGNAGRGAAIGATAGGAGGVARGAMTSDSSFQTVYKRCMAGRGHNVLN